MPITLIVETVGGAFAYNLFTFDCSKLGAGIETGLGLRVGQFVGIIGKEKKPELVRCRVAWIGEGPTGLQAVGVEFLVARTQY